MTTCDGFAKGTRRCGMVPEPGFGKCVVHLKQEGYTRCQICKTWLAPFQTYCPNCSTSKGAS